MSASQSTRTHIGRLAWLPSAKVTSIAFVVGWIVVVAVTSGFASKLSGAQENDAVNWLPGGAESTKVLHETEPFYNSDEAAALIVYERKSGITDADRQSVLEQIDSFNDLATVTRPIDPAAGGLIASPDGQALLVNAPIDTGKDGWNALGDTVDEMRDIAATSPDGLVSHITGPGGYGAENADAFAGIDGKLLYTAAAVVIVILLLTYRSPLLWLLPLVSAGVALTVAQAVLYACVKWFGLTVNGQSYAVLTVLVFGAGTDYALLLVARYREELRRHENRHEAMAFALHRAGPAILASGATVAAGMICLLLASMNSTKGMGPVSAIGIVVALAVMLTFLPAMLVIFGRWIFWPIRPTYGTHDRGERNFWGRIGKQIAKAPRGTWVVTAVVLAGLALGMFSLNATGLRNSDQFYGTPDPVKGERVMSAHFPAGSGSPLDVVAKADHADEVVDRLTGMDGIASVAPPVVKGDVAYIAATMQDAPDSEAAHATVDRVRDSVHSIAGADAKVGGGAAITEDILKASSADTRLLVPVILFVVFLILAGLLRALTAPIILIATVVLSYGAAMGLSSLLFDHVFGFAGSDTGFPLFVFVFLVALGIDYNIFLMTRVHEEAKEIGTRKGALVGLGATGGVITSAGLVLAGTFAALGTLPVISFAEIGIAVALGVLLDTLVVRSVLVTALNLDVGKAMWWPSRMAKDEPALVEDRVPQAATEGT